jgi:hypothetical protein
MLACESVAFRDSRWTGEVLATPPITGEVATPSMADAAAALGQHGPEMHLARTSSLPLQFTQLEFALDQPAIIV